MHEALEPEVHHDFNSVELGRRRVRQRGNDLGATLGRHRRQRGTNGVLPLLARGQVDEVGVAEVAVVLGVFLHAQRGGLPHDFVPVTGLLANHAALFNQFNLAQGLVIDCALQTAQRVQVLNLTAGAEGLARAPDRDVGVDTHRALFHAAVRGTRGNQDAAEFGGVGAGLGRGANVRGRDNFHQWHATAVVVNEGTVGAGQPARTTEVGRLAGVFFHVGPLDADATAVGQVEVAVRVNWQVVLRDLVVLALVRVEVVLAVEGRGRDGAMQRHTDAHRQLHGLLVEHR